MFISKISYRYFKMKYGTILQASFLSSRRYYVESTYSTYHVLDFTAPDRHGLYWHLTVPGGANGSACLSCRLAFVIRPTLLEVSPVTSSSGPLY